MTKTNDDADPRPSLACTASACQWASQLNAAGIIARRNSCSSGPAPAARMNKVWLCMHGHGAGGLKLPKVHFDLIIAHICQLTGDGPRPLIPCPQNSGTPTSDLTLSSRCSTHGRQWLSSSNLYSTTSRRMISPAPKSTNGRCIAELSFFAGLAGHLHRNGESGQLANWHLFWRGRGHGHGHRLGPGKCASETAFGLDTTSCGPLNVHVVFSSPESRVYSSLGLETNRLFS